MNRSYLIAAAVACGIALAGFLTPVIARICHARGWLDQPGPRKLHRQPTPRVTGLVLFLGIWVPALIISFVFPEISREFQPFVLPVFLGALVVLLLGIVDDLRDLSSPFKLAIQVIVGLALYFSGVSFTHLWIPFVGGFELGVFSAPVTVLWFVVMVNAVNIIDGLDGLAVATTAVATATVLWVSLTLQLDLIAVAAAGCLGGLLGFWRYNKPTAKVFMGDTGSLSLGYFFAVLALLAPIKRFTVVAFFVPVLALFLPLAESGLSVVRRSAKGRNPLRGDRGHLHHRLLAVGWPPQRIIIAYSAVTAVFGVFSVMMRYGNRRLVALGISIFVLLLGVGLGIILRKRGGSASKPQ
jgi:UDP-GlcNAc:undecaprenyl-phosphate GlcNAc-1-phosphate transferase